mmetsp:Transcript_148568/g.276733  ORF Transcript_148568/g.276733 Transcript_148568/m.276733 type:complete len:210 (+) Transcript_148568:717-1346(+)
MLRFFHFATACASIDDGVVSHNVCFDFRLLHLCKQLLSTRDIISLCTSVDNCRIARHISFHICCGHLAEPLLRTINITMLRAGTDQRVVHSAVHLHLSGLHPGKGLLRTFDQASTRKGQHKRSVCRGNAKDTCGLHSLQPPLCSPQVANSYPRIDHCAKACSIGLWPISQQEVHPLLCALCVLGTCARGECQIVCGEIRANTGSFHLPE